MRDYGKIRCGFWSDPQIKSRTDQGKVLAAYLLTCAHGTIVGAFYLPDGYVSEDLGWEPATVSAAFADLAEIGFARRCEVTKWTWLCRYLKDFPPENPNQWKATRKMAQRVPQTCIWKRDLDRSLDPEESETEPFRNRSERVSERFPNPQGTVSKQVEVVGIGEREESERDARAREPLPNPSGTVPDAPRETRLAEGGLLEDWRRDVPDVNAEKFAEWVVHVELQGRQLGPGQRTFQARQLSKQGDHAAQAEVVDWCKGNGYKSLIPLADVRARRDGMTRGGKAAGPPKEQREQQRRDELDSLKAKRADMGLADFRDPYPAESAGSYDTALRIERNDRRKPTPAPTQLRELVAAMKGAAT